jgi:RND family efflux transporter MFP subunit
MTAHYKSVTKISLVGLFLLSGLPAMAKDAAFDPFAVPSLQISKNTSGSAQDVKSVRGVVKPNAQATIVTDLVAKITHIAVKEGDRFKKGDTLLQFNCGRYYADLKAAQAEYRAEKITYRANIRLNKRRAIGRSEVDIARAKMERAEAAVAGIKVRTSDCKIKAPFNGRVVERKANEHEFSAQDKPLFVLLDDSSLEVDLIVPSAWLTWLKKGSAFDFIVDENAKTYQASIIRIGAAVDAVSQTIKITGLFKTKPADVLSGMSGTALFTQKNQALASR